MVFSSVPPNFLDHHHNWQHQLQQQPGHQQGLGGGGNPQLPPPPPPPAATGGGGSGEGSIRPGSMVDRARLAKLPLPEPGLNCPRCDSTNTKFCYFNNYNLTQPRHFCKTCRRYWTRGGALRNVPVGGGCRRNKRSSKSRSSKSPSTNERSRSQTGPKSISASPSSCSTEMNNHFTQSLQLPFMGTALQSLSHQYGSGGGTISSNLGGFQTQNEMGFQLGNGNNNILSVGGGSENWRLPFLAGFELQNNLFQYNPSDGVEAAVAAGGEMRPSSGVNTEEAAPVKVEETRALNLSRQLMGGSENNNSQHWVGTSSWTEFSGLNSSSTTHFI